MYALNRQSPIHAWATYATYRAEQERGIAHTEAWDAEMAELETALRSLQDDVRMLDQIDSRRNRSGLATGTFDERVA